MHKLLMISCLLGSGLPIHSQENLTQNITFRSDIQAQDRLNMNIEKLIKSYYPNVDDPGISVLYLEGNTPLVNQNWGVSHHEKEDKITDSSRFRMASVSKQFTAYSIFYLVQKGQLSFSTTLDQIFESVPKEFAKIEVKHLIQHTSGMVDYENLIPSTQEKPVSDLDVWNMVKEKPSLYFQPGSKFRYSNTGYCLLSLITEKISGMPYEDFISQVIFKPMGIVDAQIYTADAEIKDRAFGYRINKANEILWGDQSITSSTKGDGCVYINKFEYVKWIQNIFKNPYSVQEDGFLVKDGIQYNLGWFFTPSGLRFHSGETSGFRNFVYYDESSDKLLIVFSNRNESKLGDFVDDLMKELNLSNPISGQPLMHWLSGVYNGN